MTEEKNQGYVFKFACCCVARQNLIWILKKIQGMSLNSPVFVLFHSPEKCYPPSLSMNMPIAMMQDKRNKTKQMTERKKSAVCF